MGNEGTQWIGMSSFVETQHMVQNLGDGTYFHSGQLAVQAAVAAGVNITYKLLHNGAVAMTGGQHPEGQIGLAAIARTLFDHGVREVLITTEDPARRRVRGAPRRGEGLGPLAPAGGTGAPRRRTGRHGPDPRSGVRGRGATRPQARAGPDTITTGADQPARV